VGVVRVQADVANNISRYAMRHIRCAGNGTGDASTRAHLLRTTLIVSSRTQAALGAIVGTAGMSLHIEEECIDVLAPWQET